MAQVGAQFVNAVSPNPVGSLQAYAGASAPTGWLLCDGTSYTTAAYPELYSVLGYTYGGSGSNFNVPDLRGRVPMGAGTGAQQGGSGTGAISGGTSLTARTRGAFGGDERLHAHSHTASDAGHTHPPYPGYEGFWQTDTASSVVIPGSSPMYQANSLIPTTGTGYASITVANNTHGGVSQNMPPFIVTNYIIKAIPDAPRSGLAYGSTPPIVTALPSNPQFGDVVTYIADATNGVAWNLQYDATGTYPWKFIGGAPLVSVVAGASATASASYVALSGPTLSIALPGDYDIGASFSASYNGSAAAGMGVQIGAGGDEDYAWGITEAPGYNTTHNGTYRKTVSSAATLTSKVKSPQSVSITFAERVLRATPVRVKAA